MRADRAPPFVAVGAFDDADLWTPRGVPSTDAYVEVPGTLSVHAYGHELELIVSSTASARGLVLLGTHVFHPCVRWWSMYST